MRRESSEEMAAAVRRRLEQLGRDLGRSEDDLVRPEVVPVPGRHARGRPVPETRLRRAHLPLLGCLAAAALAVVGWFVLRGDPDPVPVARTAPAGPSAGTSPGSSPESSSAAAPAGAPSSTPAVVVVDVAGKVRRPGIATLPSGSRVVDALRRAGGARPGVDLSGQNLARVLTDGEQVLVGTKPAGGSAPAGSGSGPGDQVLVNLNTADLTELDALPGVGPVTARKIVEWRTENGSFSAVDELLEVDGIGAKTLAELAPCVTL